VVAVPVVLVLVTTIALAMGSYCVPRLRAHLMALVHDDLIQFLDHAPNLSRDELEATGRAVGELQRRISAIDLAAIEKDERQAERVASVILSDLGSATVLTEIRRRRSRQAELAVQRLMTTIERAGPRTVARWWSTWLAIASARVSLTALHDVGAKATVVLIRRAGSDVQDAGVVGLVLGTLSWVFVSQYDGDFFAYIGTGASLGAFVGLAITSLNTWRWVIAPSAEIRRGRTHAVMTVLVIIYIAGMQILWALDPSWSPFR
jgi:hypothetical protein